MCGACRWAILPVLIKSFVDVDWVVKVHHAGWLLKYVRTAPHPELIYTRDYSMNRHHNLLLFSVALSSLIIGCSDETKYKAMEAKYNAVQAEKAKHQTMSAEEMAAHADGDMHHAMPDGAAVTHKIDTDEIGRNADDLPSPLNRTQAQLVRVDLYTDELVAEMMPEVTYQYWTYNGKVPGPFIRARAGDQVEIHLSHGKPGAAHQGHDAHTSAEHATAGHSTHSIDLHAVAGPGGGAPLMQVGQGE